MTKKNIIYERVYFHKLPRYTFCYVFFNELYLLLFSTLTFKVTLLKMHLFVICASLDYSLLKKLPKVAAQLWKHI